MKKTLLVAAVAISALFAGTAAMAQDAGSLSYNIAYTTDYVWRGIEQSAGSSGALQGGIDYKKGTFYAGAWASNVDFVSGKGKQADTELDLYLGLTPTVGNYSFDFGVVYYTYPGASDATFGEIKGAVSHPLGKGTIGAAMYLPTEQLEKPYYELNASYPLTDKLSISGALGNYEQFNYTTSNIGLTYALTDKLGLDIRYTAASKGYDGSNHNYTMATLKASF